MCVGSISHRLDKGVREKKKERVGNHVIKAWREEVKAGGKKKVNMTNKLRGVQPQAVIKLNQRCM